MKIKDHISEFREFKKECWELIFKHYCLLYIKKFGFDEFEKNIIKSRNKKMGGVKWNESTEGSL